MGWKKFDLHLALLAVQASAGTIGCSWCTDFGYYENIQRGQDPAKVRDVPIWRQSEVYSDKERVVLEYAEAASSTPVEVSNDLVARLHIHFSDAEIVELAAWVALENYRSRFNAGLGLRSQGFSDSCRVPATA
jgi:alkylhydroperoxidase family enzyme